MKDYGQLIAIAIGIIVLVVNAMNKKKPKQQIPNQSHPKTPNHPQPNTGIPSLDEILREFSGETNTPKQQSIEVEPSQNYETLETSNSLEEISPYEKFNTSDYQFNYEPIIKTNKINDDVLDLKNENTTHKTEEINNELEINFNIRNAILFSEILKRPSY